MKLAWMTDIHLNFLSVEQRKNFYHKIINTNCDGILISGDIAEAPSLANYLIEITDNINKPIYFVLGNHDYYRGQIDKVREEMATLTKANKFINWLPVSGMQLLSDNTILVGQDGWADGRFGDYANSRVALNDSRMIADLFQAKMYGKFKLLDKMQHLADMDAHNLQNELVEIISKAPKRIIILTHVPPLKEACLHEGQISGDDWLPYFCSKVMGDVILSVAEENPLIDFLVLCGHTHSKAEYRSFDNLLVKAGLAEYSQPEIQEIITIS